MKFCPVCKTQRSKDLFYADRGRSDGLQYRCISCEFDYKRLNAENVRAYHRLWRKNNKEKLLGYRLRLSQDQKDRIRKSQKKNYDLGRKISDDAKSPGCSVCGLIDSCLSVFEFHHKDPKEKEIRVAALIGSPNKLVREMEKCIVVCANCHKRIHHMDKMLV